VQHAAWWTIVARESGGGAMTGSGVRLEPIDFSDVIDRVDNIFTSLFLSLPNVILGIAAFLIFWALS
jgi:small conductance mechanosensitive channel